MSAVEERGLPRGIWYATAAFALLTAVALAAFLRFGPGVVHDRSLDGPAVPSKGPTPAFNPPPAAAEGDQTAAQHWNDGILFYQRGDFAKARDEWKACLELAPENSDCATGLARIEQHYPAAGESGSPTPLPRMGEGGQGK